MTSTDDTRRHDRTRTPQARAESIRRRQVRREKYAPTGLPAGEHESN